MPNDSTDEVRTWPPMNLATIATCLGVVSALGFGYWHAASLQVMVRLDETYDAHHVVMSAYMVPNSRELIMALLGLAVAIPIFAVGWASRSKARNVVNIVAPLVLIGQLVVFGLLVGWWEVLVAIGLLIVAVMVIAALCSSLHIDLPGVKERDHPKWDRYRAVVLTVLSVLTGLIVIVVLSLLTQPKHPVVVPELGEVVILRSDSVGHFALDEDGQLMWLSRSKVDMIMAAPKSDDDTTTSEHTESSGVADPGLPAPQPPE